MQNFEQNLDQNHFEKKSKLKIVYVEMYKTIKIIKIK